MNFQPPSIDTSMELHPSQLTGPESRSSMTRSVPRPLGTKTSQPHRGPIFAITGEATSIRFLSSRSAGSTTGSLSSPSPATTDVQPFEPSSDTFVSDILPWVEKQQSITSSRQSFYRGSHDANHPSMELHPSQFTGPEFRQTSQPVPDITIGPTALMPLSGSGTTGDNTTESSNPSLMITAVQPVEPSSRTSTLQVIELEDVEVTCLLCGGAFLGYQASRHLREIHPTLVRKNDRSLCPLCTTTPAKEVTNFCRHFQKHHKILRFKCSRCSYTALERWNVERHVQKMRGKSMYVKD